MSSMGTVPSFVISDKYEETKEKELLWHVNSMRAHDGLPPFTLNQMEKIIVNCNIKFVPMENT